MSARFPVHDFRMRHGHAERHAGGDALGEDNDIRMKIEVLEGEHFSSAAHPALHLVSDQQNAILAGDLLQGRKEIRRRNNISAFSLNRFDHDRRNLAGIDGGFKYDVFEIVCAGDPA